MLTDDIRSSATQVLVESAEYLSTPSYYPAEPAVSSQWHLIQISLSHGMQLA